MITVNWQGDFCCSVFGKQEIIEKGLHNDI